MAAPPPPSLGFLANRPKPPVGMIRPRPPVAPLEFRPVAPAETVAIQSPWPQFKQIVSKDMSVPNTIIGLPRNPITLEGAVLQRGGELGGGARATAYLVYNNGVGFALRLESVEPERMAQVLANTNFAVEMGNLGIGPPVVFTGLYSPESDDAFEEPVSIIVMGLGENVKQYTGERPLRVNRAIEEVGALLRRMFAMGIYCADIKPENSIIMPDGSLRLIDFDYRWCTRNGRLPVHLEEALFWFLVLQYAVLLDYDPRVPSGLIQDLCRVDPAYITRARDTIQNYAETDPRVSPLNQMLGYYLEHYYLHADGPSALRAKVCLI